MNGPEKQPGTPETLTPEQKAALDAKAKEVAVDTVASILGTTKDGLAGTYKRSQEPSSEPTALDSSGITDRNAA